MQGANKDSVQQRRVVSKVTCELARQKSGTAAALDPTHEQAALDCAAGIPTALNVQANNEFVTVAAWKHHNTRQSQNVYGNMVCTHGNDKYTYTHLKSPATKRNFGYVSVNFVIWAPTSQDKVVPVGVLTQPPAAQLTDPPGPVPITGGLPTTGGFHLQAVITLADVSDSSWAAVVSASADAAGSTVWSDCVMIGCATTTGGTAVSTVGTAVAVSATVSCGAAAACGSTVLIVCGSFAVSTAGGLVTTSSASATFLAAA